MEEAKAGSEAPLNRKINSFFFVLKCYEKALKRFLNHKNKNYDKQMMGNVEMRAI